MKQFAIDMAYKSLNHYGEELCGDKVEIVDKEDSRILILADGMGYRVRGPQSYDRLPEPAHDVQRYDH